MVSEQTRKQRMRKVIMYSLKDILRDAKKSSEYAFRDARSYLNGALAYMCFVGDISFEDKERVLRLVRMISKKYKML